MGIEKAIWFTKELDKILQETYADYYLGLPNQPSVLYRYLSCIDKGDQDFLSQYKNIMSHRGYYMVTYGDLELGRVKGIDVATFMYYPGSKGILHYMGGRPMPPNLREFVVQEESSLYYCYLNCCDMIHNWFYHVNKKNLVDLYLESERLSNNIVLEYVIRGLGSHPYLLEREIKNLFRGILSSNLHFYRIDLGKNLVKDIS